MRSELNRLAVAGAVVALVLGMVALIGYAFARPQLYAVHAGLQSMSPVSALGILALGVAQVARFRARRSAVAVLGSLAAAIGAVVTVAQALTGDDPISPAITIAVFGSVSDVGRTSTGTALSLLLLGLAALPPFRDRPRLSDTAAAIALLLSVMALVGYSYGTDGLYALPPFRTMGLNTALAIFCLAIASILSQADGGWARAIALEGEAGRATRRQLLFTLIPPVVGFALVRLAAAWHLPIGAAMALFVVLTMAPLLWLILRDGRALVGLDEERRRRQALETQHIRVLEERLSQQAAQLYAINTRRLAVAETASKRSESRYQQLFDSIDAGFCVIEMIFDRDGTPRDYRFVEVNAAFEKQTGLRDAEGKSMRDMVPEHEQHWFDVFGTVATSHAPVRFERPAEAMQGRWYEVHAFPVGEPTRPEVGLVGILFNDVSERRRAQLQLEQLNATLEKRIAAAIAEREQAQAALRQSQKMEAMGQLTGGVAHDFNNLLTPIIGSLDLIARRGSVSERERRLIDGALQSAERAKVLVQRLLAFARRQPLQPGPVDIRELLHSMGHLATSTLGTQIRVRVEAADDLPFAMADANQLEMAILNLSVNARDAMPNGGVLTIAASAEAVTARPGADLASGDYVRICVSDTGTGMDAETLQRATEPFYSTKGIGKGTGLGLSMVHGLAAQLNGTLEIASEPGLGTRVGLWLPAAAVSAKAIPAVQDADQIETGSQRGNVLLVDDEAMVRMTTADMLQDLGYDVIEAASAQEAQAMLQAGATIDLVVTDHLMPGMTGADLARSLLADRPSLRVLLVSGYAEAEGIAIDLARLTKPFRQAELAKAIAALG